MSEQLGQAPQTPGNHDPASPLAYDLSTVDAAEPGTPSVDESTATASATELEFRSPLEIELDEGPTEQATLALELADASDEELEFRLPELTPEQQKTSKTGRAVVDRLAGIFRR